mmetsp:Transcript_10883/g.20116  ORF Transcript_10883/g.20116 Transcript_10883/m.20116 type:complete len:125 (-) Transcript_10883:277-651(-)
MVRGVRKPTKVAKGRIWRRRQAPEVFAEAAAAFFRTVVWKNAQNHVIGLSGERVTIEFVATITAFFANYSQSMTQLSEDRGKSIEVLSTGSDYQVWAVVGESTNRRRRRPTSHSEAVPIQTPLV